MLKVKITMGTGYCGCPSETQEIEYDGTEKEFNKDDALSTEILNMIFNGDFSPYFLDIETEEINEEDDN